MDGRHGVILEQNLELTPGLSDGCLEGFARCLAGAGHEEVEEVGTDASLHIGQHLVGGHGNGLVVALLDDSLCGGGLAPLLQDDLAELNRLGLVLGQGDGVALADDAALQGAGGLVGL